MGQFTSFPIPTNAFSAYTTIINVKDFGAVGDGAHDDTSAINAAYASLAGSAGTVLWPAGTYKTTDTIVCGNKTGGAGAAASFISTFCPAGPNNTVLNYAGPTDGRAAFLMAKNKYFTFTGLNIFNTGSLGSSVGLLVGGSGTGASGNQTIVGRFQTVSIGNFNTGIIDGNSGAASEILWENLSLNSNNTGWTMNDFNSLDHVFINLNMTANGVGLNSGAIECFWVYSGSSTSNGVDFLIQQNASDVVINTYRSESAGFAVQGSGNGGTVRINGCLFKDPANGGLGVGTAIKGPFALISMINNVFHGRVALEGSISNIIIENNLLPSNPQTGVPFSITNSMISHGSCHVRSKNNRDIIFPPTAIPDFEGFFKDNEAGASPFFDAILTGITSRKFSQELIATNSGSPFPFDYLTLGFVRQLAEGTTPGSLSPFTTSLTTNATTAVGSAILHFASVPATITVGLYVADTTTGAAIPSNTVITAVTSTTVTLSNVAAGTGVGNGDTIQFTGLVGLVTPGKNLRVMGQFASSGSLSLTFLRTIATSGSNGTLTATSGNFFKSDVGKPIKVAGNGNSGWTDWFGAGAQFTDSTHLLVNPADMQNGTWTAQTTVVGENEPDANYMVVVTGDSNETFWVTNITNTGFTVHSSNAASTATVTCLIVR